MPSRKTRAEILYPRRVAYTLVLASIALYLFFSIWPILFSIGIAFTDANDVKIAPNPKLVESINNAIACATMLRDNTSYMQVAIGVVRRVDSLLGSINQSLADIYNMTASGVSPSSLEYQLAASDLYNKASQLPSILSDFEKAFNCTQLGYPTDKTVVSSDVESNLTRLMELSSYLPTLQDPGRILNLTSMGLSIVSSSISYFRSIETDYKGYFNSVISSLEADKSNVEMHFIGLSNFQKLFTDPRFIYSLYKTLLFVATSVPLKVGVGVLLAFLYSTPLVYGRRVWRGLLLTPWALPLLLSGMMWKYIFYPSGPMGLALHLDINNNEWHAFLVYNLFEMWLAYPFIMTVTMGALSGVSKDLIEASYIDGASVWFRMRRITLPLISRPLVLATILTTGASLQAFMVPLLINGGGPTETITAPFLGSATGNANEFLLLFGYDRVTIDKQYGYAAATYVVVVLIILAYVALWFYYSRRGGRGW
ncbi:MAG: ABC transporter permease subunit [Thermogladius sp.]|jgi:arabinogalactan oligomer/maltooligosaccharide transport system permease protein|nr:ABC transporter permease subunit [Thermogladius sp.]